MYIADGTNIRSVDPDGIIHTLIGHHRHHNVWQPIPCKGAIPAQQVCVLIFIYSNHYFFVYVEINIILLDITVLHYITIEISYN